jgi:hypothetical protein
MLSDARTGGLVMVSTTRTCSTPGCGGPESGTCINGLSFDECPNVVDTDETHVNVVELAAFVNSSATQASVETMTPTGGAKSLDAIGCDALLRERGGKVVAIVAGPEVGKTTMIAAIYELVHRRRMPGFTFAGSETLRGYEERCHLARLASNKIHPDTPRTRTAAKLSFTHLRLKTSEHFKDVLFADRSGEHFENVLSKPAGIADFAELTRANMIIVLVDLNELLRSPHQPKSQARRLFLAMNQSGLLEGKQIRLVGTKADLMKSEEEKEAARVALYNLAADLRRRVQGNLDLEPLLIAARQGETTQLGTGLATLLEHILTPSSRPNSFHPGSAWPARKSEADNLMLPYRNRRN